MLQTKPKPGSVAEACKRAANSFRAHRLWESLDCVPVSLLATAAKRSSEYWPLARWFQVYSSILSLPLYLEYFMSSQLDQVELSNMRASDKNERVFFTHALLLLPCSPSDGMAGIIFHSTGKFAVHSR